LFFNNSNLAIVSGILSIVIIIRHLENIIRIANGTESRFGK